MYSINLERRLFTPIWGMKKRAVSQNSSFIFYLNNVICVKTTAIELATVDIVLMKISSATPTTSLRVSPTVSPVTAAL
jgi:hypothetical protein